MSDPWGKNVTVEFDNGIAFVALNRPEKRNAMSPDLNAEMLATIDALEIDERCGVLVLTGAGEAFSAGMDLKEYFRATDDGPQVKRMQIYRTAATWQWRRLLTYFKPTIAMVNGWCFGGAFTPMIACDIAIAADEATFGVSEVNWGIIPGGNVSKVLSVVMNYRKALYYIMSGETFDGKKAAELGVVTESVPRAQLRERTREVAQMLLKKNPTAVRQAKVAFKYVDEMTWDESAEYLSAKSDQLRVVDPEKGRATGMAEFLDKKTYRPGLGEYKREK
ncbi:MAG TPA: p-hydroxycinnamoyl CoA hydratase/lyase [Stellaceae bacterium]|jgi:trans-feruloyl-CoA hydratase/vanillin synthase|nr:p-hydroxycinnamoyl CoA hydratase/lyase [Stellaceae bacterium]